MGRLWIAIVLALAVGLKTQLTFSIVHEKSLIWDTSRQRSFYIPAMIMAVQGDPTEWVAQTRPEIKYIEAPHFNWEFRALGFDWDAKSIYWSEQKNKKIQALVLNGSTDTRTLFAGTSTEVSGIAVDWLSRNLYFTDTVYNWIMMTPSTPGRAGYRIVVQDGLDSPHGLAIYPQKGYLIWSDWGARPRIEVSDLEGQNRRIIVERDILKPMGVTIDYVHDRLYWVDSAKFTVEAVQLDGLGRQLIHKVEDITLTGIALYQDFIFLTERKLATLRVLDKKTPVKSYKLGRNPFDIMMYDGSQQAGNSSACELLGCEQMCIHDPVTGPKCICGEGYVPGDEESISCNSSMKFVLPSHVYAINHYICQYPANLADMSLDHVTLDSQCFLKDNQGYLTLTFDARENMLYYFGNHTKTISRIPMELGGKGMVLTGGTSVVNGMALDWVAGNLYWTETDKGIIKVSTKTGAFQRVLIKDLINPFGIVVHPGRGKIYWTAHSLMPHINARVHSANLDGSGQVVIMGDSIGEPNHLFIDFEKDYLYWTDSMLNHIRRLDLNTGRITVVFTQYQSKFYGISLYKDFIIWTDTEDRNGIHLARLDKKEKVRSVIHPRVGIASDLITVDVRNQPAFNNSCSETENICSHLCLLTENNSSKCLCGMGYQLSSDGFTCIATPVMDDFLLANDAYQKQIFQVNLKNGVVQAIDVRPYHEPIALAYDPYVYKVFWSDNKAKVIKEASIDGNYDKTVIFMNDTSMCDGMAADYVNRLIFFTDTGNNLIGVVSMRNYTLYKSLITDSLDQPRDIVVWPSEGQIYWSDWGSTPRIEKSDMDGTERETVVQFNSTAWPNGLALDAADKQLYWVDAHSDQVSVIDLTTGAIRVLVEQQGAHFFSVDVIGAYLYITDWKKNYLQRMNKHGGALKQFGEAKFTRLYGIKGFNSTEAFKGISVCVQSVCNQLCLPKKGRLYSCACSEGYIADGPWCKPETTTTTTISSTGSPSSTSPLPEVSSSQAPEVTTKPSHTTATTNQLMTSEKTSVITTMPRFTGMSSTVAPDVTTEAGDNYVTTVPLTAEPRNTSATVTPAGKVQRSTAASGTLGTGYIIFIVIIIVAIIVLAAAVGIYIKRRFYPTNSHGKLVEEHNPANFYKIDPATGEDSVTIDSGIVNPSYDYMNGAGNASGNSSTSAAAKSTQ